MTLNEGTPDRVIRLVAAAVLISWWAGFGSVAGIILLVFAGWMFVTGGGGILPGLLACQDQHAPVTAPDLNAAAQGGNAPLAFRDFPRRFTSEAARGGSGPRAWRADQ